MVVDPTGRVIDELGLYQDGIMVADVALLNELTFYSRYGDVPLITLSLVLVILGTALTVREPKG
jgi:apolipoprotein N-acyltransferase